MNCEQAELSIHALVDGELDAVNTREIEEHVAACAACAAELETLRALRAAMARARLKEPAPARLAARIDDALPGGPSRAAPLRGFVGPSRRSFFGGFAAGAVLSGALAASLMLTVLRDDEEDTVANEVVSAHIRSLQAGHLTDVQTSDQHTVKPWFNGKLDLAPPVVDLTAQGFTLLGGRLDYVDGEPVASVVYQRRRHIINLFVAQRLGSKQGGTKAATIQGYNARHWSAAGLDFWAVSDIAAAELDEFVGKISVAVGGRAPPS
jgi:anti-sigma factor RsiW